MDHWLPSLRIQSVGGSTCGSPGFTAHDFTFVVRDGQRSTTNHNINIERWSMVLLREPTFPGSPSLLVYSLLLVGQAARSNAIEVLRMIKRLDEVYLGCPFGLGSSGALARHFNYEK